MHAILSKCFRNGCKEEVKSGLTAKNNSRCLKIHNPWRFENLRQAFFNFAAINFYNLRLSSIQTLLLYQVLVLDNVMSKILKYSYQSIKGHFVTLG